MRFFLNTSTAAYNGGSSGGSSGDADWLPGYDEEEEEWEEEEEEEEGEISEDEDSDEEEEESDADGSAMALEDGQSSSASSMSSRRHGDGRRRGPKRTITPDHRSKQQKRAAQRPLKRRKQGSAKIKTARDLHGILKHAAFRDQSLALSDDQQSIVCKACNHIFDGMQPKIERNLLQHAGLGWFKGRATYGK